MRRASSIHRPWWIAVLRWFGLAERDRLGHAPWVVRAARKGHNATDFDCTYWMGDVGIVPNRTAAAGDVLGGRAGDYDNVMERRCLICRPRTPEEERDVLDWPWSPGGGR